MSEFSKEKITFAIGLLAVLFALTPLLQNYGAIGFYLFGVHFSLLRIYVFIAAVLGIAVYCYGWQFLTERVIRPAVLAGDILYVVALVAPVLFAILFLVAKIIALTEPVIQSPHFRASLLNIISAILGAGAAVLSINFTKKLSRRQRELEAKKRESVELAVMRRAEDLLRAGQADLAVIEAFRALEVAVRSNPDQFPKRADRRAWFDALSASVPDDLRLRLAEARQTRNAAAHATEPVLPEAARQAVNTVSKVLAILAGKSEQRCPECGSSRYVTDYGSDHGYYWERKRCEDCGYLDLG